VLPADEYRVLTARQRESLVAFRAKSPFDDDDFPPRDGSEVRGAAPDPGVLRFLTQTEESRSCAIDACDAT